VDACPHHVPRRELSSTTRARSSGQGAGDVAEMPGPAEQAHAPHYRERPAAQGHVPEDLARLLPGTAESHEHEVLGLGGEPTAIRLDRASGQTVEVVRPQGEALPEGEVGPDRAHRDPPVRRALQREGPSAPSVPVHLIREEGLHHVHGRADARLEVLGIVDGRAVLRAALRGHEVVDACAMGRRLRPVDQLEAGGLFAAPHEETVRSLDEPDEDPKRPVPRASLPGLASIRAGEVDDLHLASGPVARAPAEHDGRLPDHIARTGVLHDDRGGGLLLGACGRERRREQEDEEKDPRRHGAPWTASTRPAIAAARTRASGSPYP